MISPILYIRAKLRGITREDAIQFARDNGIRRPDAIIREVVASLKQFRAIATKYGVSEQWTGRVETTIIDHLKAWGEWQEDAAMPELTINGLSVANIRIEQAYKGNFHCKPIKAISTCLLKSMARNVSSS